MIPRHLCTNPVAMLSVQDKRFVALLYPYAKKQAPCSRAILGTESAAYQVCVYRCRYRGLVEEDVKER